MTSAAIQIHGHRRRRVAVFVFIAFAFGTAMGYAQSADDPQSTLAIPSSNLRVRFDMLGAGYWDYNQAPLGHESQGRIGWAIIGLSGEINPYISFAAELNPVNDSARPQPACGETNYFYPNVPSWPGPQVACVPDGRNRVDLYRFVGLDPLTQQNSVRVAVIDVHRQSALLGSRHRDRPDPAAPLPSPAAPSRRIPARPVRDEATVPIAYLSHCPLDLATPICSGTRVLATNRRAPPASDGAMKTIPWALRLSGV